MKEYDFTLKFTLRNSDIDPDIYVEKLYESGCDDALIGIGKKGYISLNFTRESTSAVEAISNAVSDVRKVIPQACLIEASPDLVGITDVAEILDCSRQNVRKLILNQSQLSPPAVYEGAQDIWHLADILDWLIKYKAYQIDESLIEIAKANENLNIAQKLSKLDPELQENFKTLVV